MTKPSVIVGGFPELAEMLKRTGKFERVFQVGSTATFQQQAASGQYPGKESLVLVFADNTPEDGPKLEFVLSRLAGAGYPALLLNLGGAAATISAKYPALGTVKGGATLNQILGAIAGMTNHTLEAVEWGHVPVTPGMAYPPESEYGAEAMAPESPEERSGYVPRPARDAWHPAGDEGGPNPKQRIIEQQQAPQQPQPQPQQQGAAPAGSTEGGGWSRVDTSDRGPETAAPQPMTPQSPQPQQPAPQPRQSAPQQQAPQQPQPQQPAPQPRAPAARADQPSSWEGAMYAEGEPQSQAPAPRPRNTAPQGVVVPSGGLHAPNKCTAITVAASKGGTGKSSVALNIAAFLGLRTNQEVAVIDLNIQQADVGKYIGDYESKTVVDLVSNLPQITPDNIRDYMSYSREGDFYAVLGPHNPQHADPGVLNSRLYKTILDQLRRTFDYVIIDTPVAERYHDLVTNFAMKEADRVVFVVAPNWTTVHNARLYLDMMTREVTGPRLPPDRVGWVLNQYRDDIDCDVDQVRDAMAHYRYLGTLPYTTEWQRANNNFELIVTQRYEDINRSFAEMLREVTGVDFPVRPAAPQKKGWFDRVRGR